MNKIQILALAGIALLATATVLYVKHDSKVESDDDLQAQWNSFKLKFNKKFSDPDFEQYRIQVFAENLKVVKTNPANFGITQFMDLTHEEFKSTYLTLQAKNTFQATNVASFNDAGVEIDWTTKGAVTPVKDQGQCGSCWSFSTTGAVEGALVVAGKPLVSLSEQYLVDCSKNGNEGCNGGLMDTAFTFIKANGITTEAEYPYKAVDGKCTMKSGAYKISSFTDIKDCNDLVAKVQVSPIAIAVDANNFQYYTSGVFSDCQTSLDHGVLLVGYSASGKYWKVKNSWGASWGEKGYIRLAAGNSCGLCNSASYPTA